MIINHGSFLFWRGAVCREGGKPGEDLEANSPSHCLTGNFQTHIVYVFIYLGKN